MTDEVLEGAPTTPEPVEPAVPPVLEVNEEVKPPSIPPVGLTEDRLNELLEERLGPLTETLERQAQSAKDRGISANAKQINDILARLEELGGNKEALIQEVDQTVLLNKVAQLEAQISQSPVQPAQTTDAQSAWQAEWAGDSQKILDVAAKNGVELTPEEYNAAMFNNSVAFATKGDAYAALNQAIVSKAKGESIPVAAVAIEGGNVASPPAPPAPPKTSAQQFDKAKADGNFDEMRRIQDERWNHVEKLQKVQTAQQALDAAGVSAEDLLEQ